MAATILLVESDLIDRADWQALLQFHGYKVHAAPNGKSALDCFPSLQPDLVLMSSTLTDIPSDEVCRRMKADPLNGDIPIVMVGSYLTRLSLCQDHQEMPGDTPANPATRGEALGRIHALLDGGQFHLFKELSEEAHGCPMCYKRQIETDSIEFDG